MTKRLVDIEDSLLLEAQRVCGASTMKSTVAIALKELVDTETRRQHLVRLMTGEGTDLADEDLMQGAWR